MKARRAVMTDRLKKQASWQCLAGLSLVLLAVPAAADTDVLGQMDRQVTTLVERAKPAVVSIQVEPREASRQSKTLRFFHSRVGTGFCIDRNGLILTTANVIGKATQVQVRLSDGRELDGRVLGSDYPTGIAVVKVAGIDLPALRLAENDHPEPGQWAIVVGNPGEARGGVWVGTLGRTDVQIASSLPMVFEMPDDEGRALTIRSALTGLPSSLPEGKLLQIDVPVSPGASGAPVLNSRGDVIGVVVATSGFPPAAGLPFGAMERGSIRHSTDPAVADKDWSIETKRFAAEAKRQGEAAARHAQEMSRKIEEKAQQLSRGLAERARLLQQRMEAEERRAAQDRSFTEAQRQQLQAETARRFQMELQPVLRDLREKLERDLQPLQAEQQRRLEQDLAPLQEELQQLNRMLPGSPGVRELRFDLAPQIRQAIEQAHAAAQKAIDDALKASQIAPTAPPAQPTIPSPLKRQTAPAPSVPETQPEPAPESPAPGAVLTSATGPPPGVDSPLTALALEDRSAVPLSPAPRATVQFWAGRSQPQGASTYAIPAGTARWAMEQLRDHGHVAHLFLGLQIADLKPEDRQRLNAPGEAHVRVLGVVPKSPASEAGIQKDDLILEFQGRRVDSASDLLEQTSRTQPGAQVSLQIWRGGERRQLPLTPRELPARPWLFRGPTILIPPNQPLVLPRAGSPFLFRGPAPVPHPGPAPILRIYPPGHVTASASGTGHQARVSLEAQEARLDTVLRELSRVTGLQLTAAGEAGQTLITLKVESVPIDDLINSLEHLYHLRGERSGDQLIFKV